jgi:ribosomal protein L7/L12
MNISQDTESKVRLLVQQHRKLEAVKLVYDTTHCGLKEAKDYVDNLESPIPHTPTNTNNIDDTILALLAENKKIHAVKYYKDQTGKPLAESLAYVDSLYKNRKPGQQSTTMNTEIDKIIRQQGMAPGSKKHQGNFLPKLLIFLVVTALAIYLLFLR